MDKEIDQQTVITPTPFTSINPKIGMMTDAHCEEWNGPNYTAVTKDLSK